MERYKLPFDPTLWVLPTDDRCTVGDGGWEGDARAPQLINQQCILSVNLPTWAYFVFANGQARGNEQQVWLGTQHTWWPGHWCRVEGRRPRGAGDAPCVPSLGHHRHGAGHLEHGAGLDGRRRQADGGRRGDAGLWGGRQRWGSGMGRGGSRGGRPAGVGVEVPRPPQLGMGVLPCV
jgi:hypothetical protein